MAAKRVKIFSSFFKKELLSRFAAYADNGRCGENLL
jgi:hypothetical protein